MLNPLNRVRFEYIAAGIALSAPLFMVAFFLPTTGEAVRGFVKFIFYFMGILVFRDMFAEVFGQRFSMRQGGPIATLYDYIMKPAKTSDYGLDFAVERKIANTTFIYNNRGVLLAAKERYEGGKERKINWKRRMPLPARLRSPKLQFSKGVT